MNTMMRTILGNIGFMMLGMAAVVTLVFAVELALELRLPTLSGVRPLDAFLSGVTSGFLRLACILIVVECAIALVKGVVRTSAVHTLLSGVVCGLGATVVLVHRLPGFSLGWWGEVSFIAIACLFSLCIRLLFFGAKA